MSHPPWLRFQVYGLGLPKTGSTSLATIFGNYRSGHEVGMRGLLAVGLPWWNRDIAEDEFWARATPRLTRPALEMDSATCHHLYADLLVQRYGNARFIHSVRDVGGWLSSLLDMSQRYAMSRTRLGIGYTEEELRYMDLITMGTHSPQRDPRTPDVASVVPMMRFWAEHMDRLASVLPLDRSLVVRTRDLGARLEDLAALCGVPPETLRGDLTHSNKASHTCDRLALYDSPELRAAYDRYCAPVMARLFPEEHARAFQAPVGALDWEAHCDETQEWVIDAIAKYGTAVGR